MSEKGKIEPHRITKPIQLLAAWLLGLIMVNGAFLIAAGSIEKPDWVVGALVIASIINVPVFLVSIFLLQTKFRPEMQEDSFYSQYLESKTGNTEREVTTDSVANLREDLASIERIVAEKMEGSLGVDEIARLKWSSVTVMLNTSLSNFSAIAKKMSEHNIPIHETFGSGGGKPDSFHVAIGAGFDLEQIRKIVEALSFIPNGVIAYAHEDDEGPGQYDNQVLIGAYGSGSHGIKIEKALLVFGNSEVTIADVYRVIGA
jgi:hypothetical protein